MVIGGVPIGYKVIRLYKYYEETHREENRAPEKKGGGGNLNRP